MSSSQTRGKVMVPRFQSIEQELNPEQIELVGVCFVHVH